ncbi:transcription factor WhiB [Enemella dayhoffiae]|uniref:Transcriptional regulator WhiB n=1 Tax=Enemella dayhoffiae TaxID=2016507 RepID=A0A255GUS2_9ACTN|nr:WhiB family transcriptional regulator [Enemella dayhoffiae]OYO19380.1 transcription factor WhiB [Enemella dayhoffiae]
MNAITDEYLVTATGLPCHLVDPDVFFAELPAEIEYAKTLCAECPIRAQCLAGALERREACGVWGGELFVNGVVVARKRPRGRPRKNPLPVVPQAPAAVRQPVVAAKRDTAAA